MGSSRSIRSKISALIIILAFVNKLGLGLFMHIWFHETRSQVVSDSKDPAFHLVTLKCTCVDDAMIPFEGSDIEIETKTAVKYFVNYSNSLRSFYSSIKKVFYGLRGPPALKSKFESNAM